MAARTAVRLSLAAVALLAAALLLPSSAQNTCSVLDAKACAETCVPLETGGGTTDFACGDWWTKSRCCKGTEEVQFTTTNVYFRCRCDDTAMTEQGLGVIIAASIAAALAVLVAVLYVLYRKRMKLAAENEERQKALEEAQVYLPR